jgi:hypothetical protein
MKASDLGVARGTGEPGIWNPTSNLKQNISKLKREGNIPEIKIICKCDAECVSPAPKLQSNP